jgi:glycosyltransferase involved in cell wall biosynthesis
MDYFPNIDGVCHFVQTVFPLVRAKMPGVEFRIVGSAPHRKIRYLGKIPGVVVTGHVADVRTYLRDAAVSIAPLRIASGTQNKILESMAMRIPVVATPEAAKGIRAAPGRHLMVADNPETFAKHILDLLKNAELRERFATAALTQVERAHQWPLSMRILDDLLAETPGSDIVQC